MDQQNQDDDFECVGYVSWVEEVGLFFVTLAACGSMVWLFWLLFWWIGKSAGFWS